MTLGTGEDIAENLQVGQSDRAFIAIALHDPSSLRYPVRLLDQPVTVLVDTSGSYSIFFSIIQNTRLPREHAKDRGSSRQGVHMENLVTPP